MRVPKEKKPEAPQPVLPLVEIHLAPAAEARLSEASAQQLGSAPETALPGWQSLGKDHKPTRATTRQGPRERKVRW
ncbi:MULTISPECIES: hypothetical protein [Arthrobacter]|uniref:Uncharacterized protein n=1 Tax=Arthrobacter jinronghuae TaxID=2964609 RepID=A0ABT1NSH0_9MICC|nr:MULTISPECIES: hypothetical protein [Arthrobacter]MCQ1950623.1 hypothetical protein [Arthrobacter jinronghuae]MCQ1953946.1 hypothetical protein [Arthrobacter sp. zg-Y238]MCQ1956843.1 hypothetical protein [Arthrobacter jinronghuae]UWX79101.1 hypothetical protein N2K98_02490 [Arthrobacter jinronghuae]